MHLPIVYIVFCSKIQAVKFTVKLRKTQKLHRVGKNDGAI